MLLSDHNIAYFCKADPQFFIAGTIKAVKGYGDDAAEEDLVISPTPAMSPNVVISPNREYRLPGIGHYAATREEANRALFSFYTALGLGHHYFRHELKIYTREGVLEEFGYVHEPMISPFEPSLVRKSEGNSVISYGVSSYGYDIRCGDEFKVFTNVNSTIIDPKNFDPGAFVEVKGPKCIIPPNSFALARTIERFSIPRNVLTICLGKSTYARTGIVVNVTPFEPGWKGQVTLEFSNTTPLPAIIYANEGVAQVLFAHNHDQCRTSYADRGGKYQGQTGVTLPRL